MASPRLPPGAGGQGGSFALRPAVQASFNRGSAATADQPQQQPRDLSYHPTRAVPTDRPAGDRDEFGALFSSFVEEDRRDAERAAAIRLTRKPGGSGSSGSSAASTPRSREEQDNIAKSYQPPDVRTSEGRHTATRKGKGGDDDESLMPWEVSAAALQKHAENYGSEDSRSKLPGPEQVDETVYVYPYRKPSDEEPAILAYARYLGLDPVQDRELLWVAQQAVVAPLPEGWREVRPEEEGGAAESYYYNAREGVSTYEHPLDGHFRTLVGQLRSQKQMRREKIVAQSLRPTWGGLPIAFHDHRETQVQSRDEYLQAQAVRHRDKERWAEEQVERRARNAARREKRLLKTTLRLQAIWRSRLFRHIMAQRLVRRRAVLRLQAATRGWLSRRSLLAHLTADVEASAAIRMQARIRGVNCRRRLRGRLNRLRLRREHRAQATARQLARTVAQYWATPREQRPPLEEVLPGSGFDTLCAATLLQAIWRGRVSRKKAREELAHLQEECALVLVRQEAQRKIVSEWRLRRQRAADEAEWRRRRRRGATTPREGSGGYQKKGLRVSIDSGAGDAEDEQHEQEEADSSFFGGTDGRPAGNQIKDRQAGEGSATRGGLGGRRCY